MRDLNLILGPQQYQFHFITGEIASKMSQSYEIMRSKINIYKQINNIGSQNVFVTIETYITNVLIGQYLILMNKDYSYNHCFCVQCLSIQAKLPIRVNGASA